MKNHDMFLLIMGAAVLLAVIFFFGYVLGWQNGITATKIDAFKHGVAVPQVVNDQVKYNWINPPPSR
jgi:hypothetical protein